MSVVIILHRMVPDVFREKDTKTPATIQNKTNTNTYLALCPQTFSGSGVSPGILELYAGASTGNHVCLCPHNLHIHSIT